MSDDDLINTAIKAKNGAKFAALMSGDDSDYGSRSEADMAFCNLLAFYTKDAEQIDRIFRRSGLMREKWDRDDYSIRTIQEALDTVTEQYQKRPKKPTKVIPLYDHESDDSVKEKPQFKNTDLGNAQRLVYHFGDDLRYCYHFGSWYIWDGKRWNRDETGEIDRRAKQTVRNIYQEALEADDDRRAALAKHAVASEARNKISNMIALSQSEEGIPVTPTQLDGDNWLLNCANGVVDLKTGKLLNHKRDYMMTNMIPTAYDPTAECPNWLKFLNRIMQDEQGRVRTELVDFLQKAVGYALTGSIKEQVMFFLYGSGKNGKSTFINTIKDLLGDYAKQSGTETFMMKQQQSAANNDIARLKGARLVSAVESEEGKRLAESLIKQLTGGEPITARFLHQEHFEFLPTFKIFFITNHKPQIRGTDPAIWRRIRLIPFTVTITAEEDDKTLPEKLRNEMPGILRWMVEGCLRWQEEGLGTPEEVTNATQGYREEMDTLSQFIDEHCVIEPTARVPSKDLYKEYQQWCEDNGEYVLAKNKFITRLKDRLESSMGVRIEDYRTNAARGYTGIGLLSNPIYGDLVRKFTLHKGGAAQQVAAASEKVAFWEKGEID
jgi:putative DNA primase/helicase